ncbi:MAG: hypothetical protein WDW38_009122 [Sanguina aurantia]
MFVLSVLEDDVRVLPSDLTKAPLDAVTDVLQSRFLDKVIPDLGLVITVYDVTSIEGGFVYPNDGAAYFKTVFRLVIFRPFLGEVLVGKLKSSSRAGLTISLDFFDDVFVPEHALQDPSFYNEEEKLWVWRFDGNEMFMDLGEQVRVQVTSVKFHPVPSPAQLAAATGDDKLLGTAAKPYAPLEVIASMTRDGLGLLCWWTAAAEPEAEEE